MNTEKYKIWDTETRQWFRPTYPRNKETRTQEILFTQSGELVMHEKDELEGVSKLSIMHSGKDAKGVEVCRFVPCVYTGVKDVVDVKAYLHDRIICSDDKGTVILENGRFMIQWDSQVTRANELLAIEPSGRKRIFEIIGNVLEE